MEGCLINQSFMIRFFLFSTKPSQLRSVQCQDKTMVRGVGVDDVIMMLWTGNLRDKILFLT